MKFVALLVLFVVAASKPIVFNPELNENWNEFKKAFGKNYNLSEEISRRSIWEKRVEYITQHNLRYDLGLTSYRMGLNKDSDMEHEEFVRTFIGNQEQPQPFGQIFIPSDDLQTPPHVDWREAGIVTPVKNQGGCNSCWAFSAAGALEGMQALETGRLVPLSEQMLVDCAVSKGCKGGGWKQAAFQWVILNGGIDTEASYPYIDKQGECKFNPDNVGAKAVTYYNLRKGNEEDLKIVVALIGPVAITLGALPESFWHYKEGIYDDPNCYNGIHHAVLLVGYGTENGKDYWLIKNSWGTSHGDKGYWKMSRNKNNQCNITENSAFPAATRLASWFETFNLETKNI